MVRDDFENAIVSAGAEVQFRHRHPDQFLRFVV